MKKSIIIILGVLLILVLLTKFCNNPPENSPDRNIIKFKDSISNVSDSIKEMNILMSKLPPFDKLDVEYTLDKNELHFNLKTIGYFNNDIFIWNSNYSDKTLCGLNSFEIKRFFSLILYLKKNYLTSYNWHKNENIGDYSYRALDSEYTGDYDFDFYRTIILLNDGLIINDDFNKSLQILDRKESLILVAPIGSKIF